MNNLLKQLVDIFFNKETYLSNPILNIDKIKNGYQITFGAMYNSPGIINLERLILLSDIFGTKEIDVDDYAQSGCESCDYGSSYGHDIQVLNPTKNLEELEKLVGKRYNEKTLKELLTQEII